MNPYKTLDIREDASDALIKNAYRQMSKIHHPDKGGSEAKFQTINLAYRVLSDPKKRKLYDDTGVVDDASPNHIDNLIRARLVNVGEKWLDQLLKGGTASLQSFALSGFKRAQHQLASANSDLKKQITQIEEITARLTCSDDGSIIHGVLAGRVATYKKGIHQNEMEMTVLEHLHTAIESYEYEEEVTEEVLFRSSTSTSSTMFSRVNFF